MIGEKIQKLRRENNMTQEQLADYLLVSRQSVSKWESDMAYPETEKIIKLAELFHVSTDYLLRDDFEQRPVCHNMTSISKLHYEYKSKRTLFGLPLVHINVGLGFYKAKGIISIGVLSKGFISLGLFSLGLLSLGLFSLGLIALGNFALGVVSAGAIAIGIIAIGAIAVGIFSIGALSVGYFSVGALACGRYVAIGDHSYALIAIAKTKASGTYVFLSDAMDKNKIKELIDEKVPSFWIVFKAWIKAIV